MSERLTPTGPAEEAPSGARWIRAARSRRRISQRELEIDHEREALIDRGARRFPAHLTAQRVLGYFESPKPGYTDWWGWHNIAWPFTDEWVPANTYWRRGEPPPVISLEAVYSLRDQVWDDAT
jgi:hypothetical protein